MAGMDPPSMFHRDRKILFGQKAVSRDFSPHAKLVIGEFRGQRTAAGGCLACRLISPNRLSISRELQKPKAGPVNPNVTLKPLSPVFIELGAGGCDRRHRHNYRGAG